jgi:succinyl-diaminopimelate desuccinylase
MEPRLNVNQVGGGLARNIVPDVCTFSVDRRLLPDETVDNARAEILQTLDSVEGAQWDILREFVIPPVPPCDDPEAEVLSAIVGDVTGSTGLYGEMISGELPYATGRYWGGKVFGTGVIRPESHIHGVDEFVYERDLRQLGEVLERFLTGHHKEAA